MGEGAELYGAALKGTAPRRRVEPELCGGDGAWPRPLGLEGEGEVAREAGDVARDGKEKKSVAAVGAETSELRRRMGSRAGDARAEVAREARAYVDARAAEAAKVRAYVEKARIRTTEDTL